jgi:Tol biopolymer transport system component
MQSDGAKAKIVADSLDLQGSPAWCPDGRSITSAATDHGATRLFRIPLDNTPPVRLLEESSLDPAWSPDGAVVVYSGPDIGTTFPLRAATAAGANHPMQPLTLTRGARHTTFLGKGTTLVFLRGDLQHKDLWTRDLLTGEEHRLTSLAPGFNIRDFDISPDGREAILERVQDRSDVVLLDLPQR